jgi:acetyltransferase-like isoleucine patch superfamily enzyme
MDNEMNGKPWASPVFNENGMTQWGWRVTHLDKFKVGQNVQIGSFTMIDAQEGVEIQDDVMVGPGCALLSYSSIDAEGGRIILCKACKVGANTVIMPGVTIGQNAIIGANSFVNRDIPENELWIGAPAKYKKKV